MAPTTRRRNGHAPRPSIRHPIPKDVLVELTPKHNQKCMFCGRKEISELLYGPLYQLNDVIVHYFCILLSSRAVQKGTDKEGIWGFLLKDIKSELDRGSRQPCFYCNEHGATISCCGLKCRKIFHLPCGLQNGSMHQYFQAFKSFCQQHRITQTIDLKELQKSDPVQCSICKEDVLPTPLPTSLWAPCCKRNAWFHRKCIQELALSAGYFFKCPLCNNVETFKSRMLTLGIYIPSRDASWETVPNAFAELLERHSTCDVPNCVCPHTEKRSFRQEDGSWEIVICHSCGSSGTHKKCSSLKFDQPWTCSNCSIIDGSKRRKIESTNGEPSSQILQRLERVNGNSISSTITKRLDSINGCSTSSTITKRLDSINSCSTSSTITHRLDSINGCSTSSSSSNQGATTIDISTNSRNSKRGEKTNNASTTRAQPLNQNSSLRRTSARRASRIRESTRLNNSREMLRQNESVDNTSTSHVEIIDTIVISSDDSDHDSDIQCVTYIDQPRTAIPLPIITSCTSISSINNFNGFPHGISSTQQDNVLYNLPISIDLTISDDENDSDI